MYLFWDGPAWEMIIGSANLTKGAMENNSELSTLISSKDKTPGLKNEIIKVIQGYWNWDNARTISQDDANHYREVWKVRQSDIRRLSDQYGDKTSKKLAIDSSVMSMDWPKFLERVRQDKIHSFNERIGMLEAVRVQFTQHAHFKDMKLDIRLGIAGLESEFFPHFDWFGGMRGSGDFKKSMKENYLDFSSALDQIPLQGDVTRAHFDRFISEYRKAFTEDKRRLATATRLLTMKRPDTFVCVNAANRRLLSKDMGINRPDQLNYERYWEEVILRLRDSPWWQSPEPIEPEALAVWQGRAAMIDAIFYEL